ncbi:MAG TPA: hypothetical protein VGK84_00515 [Candidatus Tumulicola sp.]
MRHHHLSVLAIFVVAGCSGPNALQPAVSSDTANGFIRAAHLSAETKYPSTASLIFESNDQANIVNVFKTKRLGDDSSPVATIAVGGCPYGLAMSNGGSLYVADNCSGNKVEIFPKGSTEMSSSITKGISGPSGLAMDHKDTLFVANYPAAITEYERGKTSPSKTITGGGMTRPYGLALDSRENLYIADYGADAVFEVKAGTTTVTKMNLQNAGEPLGVAVDQKNDILWETNLDGNVINLYHLRGSDTTLPFEVIRGQGRPYAIAIQNHGNPLGEVVESDVDTDSVYAYHPNTYEPYVTLRNDVGTPAALLITKP